MAAAPYGRVPERLDRDAQREGRHEVECVVDDDDGNEDPGGPAGPAVCEDAQVQQENGDLGACQAQLVAEESGPR